MFAEDISEDRRYHFYTGFYSISGYLRNLRGRLLSSEKFSEVFALWVFTLWLVSSKFLAANPVSRSAVKQRGRENKGPLDIAPNPSLEIGHSVEISGWFLGAPS